MKDAVTDRERYEPADAWDDECTRHSEPSRDETGADRALRGIAARRIEADVVQRHRDAEAAV